MEPINIETLRECTEDRCGPYLEFLRKETMSVDFYRLDAG